MHLSGLSPFGPIFGKELRTASRRRRNYFLRVAYLGLLLLLLLWAFTITREAWGPTSVALRVQQQEQLGSMFFIFFAIFCVVTMALIGPVLTCTAINEERLHRTLHVLLMTPLTAWQIVSGKLFSRLLTALTLIGLSLPVLALVRLLGGVELQQMFGVVCLCAVTALASAALGLLLSVLLRRAYAVIILSYLLMAGVYLFLPMLWFAIAQSFRGGGRMRTVETMMMVNPFWCTSWLASGMRRTELSGWVPCVLLHLAVAAVLLVVSALLLRREARREGEAAGPLPPATPADAGRGPVPPPLPSRRAERTVSDMPVLWRELRRPLMTRRWQRIAGTIACLALLSLTYLAAGLNNALDETELQSIYAVVFHTAGILFACVLSATAIAQEKEGDTWTVLLASPLSGSAIVWGKALGAARRLFWPIMLIVGHFLIFTVGGVLTPLALLQIISVIVGFNAIWVATGIYFSLRCRKVTIAVIINLALPVLLYGVLTMLVAVIDEVFRVRGLLDHVTWYLPYYYLTEVIDTIERGGESQLPGGKWASAREFVTLTLTIAALHVGVAVAILRWTAYRFDRIVGRAAQEDPLRIAPGTGPIARRSTLGGAAS